MFGHKEKFSERSLIILNHRCHFDWLFFWMVVGKRGDASSWLVMLKRIGKVAPFFGGYIFPIGVYYRYINSHVYYVIAFFIKKNKNMQDGQCKLEIISSSPEDGNKIKES